MKQIFARTLLVASLLFGAQSGNPANYPDGAVQVLVPNGAGAPIDTIARMIALRLQSRLGQPFPVLNRPGAGHAIAAGALLNARPLWV